MIVISDKPGQLGNLLVVYSNFYAFSLEYSLKVYNPSFYAYNKYFTNLNRGYQNLTKLIYFFSFYFTKILARLKINNTLLSYKRIDWNEEYLLQRPEKNDAMASHFCFVQGWQYRNTELIKKYHEKIKQKFAPSQSYQSKLDNYLKQHFSDAAETIIGIHVRLGDYATFENGKYYYSFEQYSKIMNSVEQIFNTSKIHFLVCSNVSIPEKSFEGIHSKITFGPGHELLDMYSFTACDYLVGPPSTFTFWASFYGKKPLYMVKEPDAKFKIEDFKIAAH